MRSKCRHGDLLTVTYSKNGPSQSLSAFSPLLGGVGGSAKYLDGPSSMIGAHPRRSCFRRFREKIQLKSLDDKQKAAVQRSRGCPDKVGARLSLSRESGPLPRPTNPRIKPACDVRNSRPYSSEKQNALNTPLCHLQRLILRPDSVDILC